MRGSYLIFFSFNVQKQHLQPYVPKIDKGGGQLLGARGMLEMTAHAC